MNARVLLCLVAVVGLGSVAQAQEASGPRWFSVQPEDVETLGITCPGTPIPPNTVMTGTLSRATDCIATIQTGLGPLPVVGDVYTFSTIGAITVTLDGGDFSDYFGLPYIVLIDPNGTPIAAKLGTTTGPNGVLRAVMTYTVPTFGRWAVLVTGVGGDFATPVGQYAVTVAYQPRLKRRAVRH